MDFNKPGPTNVKVITRRELFNKMQQQNLPNINEKLDFVESYLLNYDDYTEAEIKEIKHNFSRFKSEMKSRWTAAHNKEDAFIKKNSDWLQGTFMIPRVVHRPGRPTKAFLESSERSKRRKTEKLRSSTDVEILTHATQVKLATSGKRDAAHIIKEFSRVSCNQDVLNRLLLSSDPLLTGMRPLQRKKTQPSLIETIDMLLPAEPYEAQDTEETDEEEIIDEPELSSNEEISYFD